MEDYYRSIGMPVNLRELGVHPTDQQFRELARKCSVAANDSLGVVKKLHQADMEAIYRAAL